MPSGRVVHSLLPPHDGGAFTSTSSYAFGVSFTGHCAAIVELSGETRRRLTFGPGTVGLNGAHPLVWIEVVERSESVELHPTDALLEEVGALTGCDWRRLDDFRQIEADPVVWATCAAFRADAGGLADSAKDDLVRNLTLHVAVHLLGGRPLPAFAGRLDPKRLGRVGAFVEANTHRLLLLEEMASVAAISRFHFHRAFQRTTAVTPGAFAMAKRMERAHRAMASGAPMRSAAAQLGIADLSYFRLLPARPAGPSLIPDPPLPRHASGEGPMT